MAKLPHKETVNQIELRDSINKLAVPLPKTDCYKQFISYSGSILWNNLATSERIAGNFFQSWEKSSESWCSFSNFKHYITSSLYSCNDYLYIVCNMFVNSFFMNGYHVKQLQNWSVF